jgi:hypothetical protein
VTRGLKTIIHNEQGYHFEVTAKCCHRDRVRRSKATEGEWRDPETLSFAMPLRGVLPRLAVKVVWEPCTRLPLADPAQSPPTQFFLNCSRAVLTLLLRVRFISARNLRRRVPPRAKGKPAYNLIRHRVSPRSDLLRCLVLDGMRHVNGIKPGASQCAGLYAGWSHEFGGCDRNRRYSEVF